MTPTIVGFISEMDKLSASKRDFARAKRDPFSRSLPFSKLTGWQKGRVIAGIGGNLAFGTLPIVGAGIYGAKKLLGKHEDTVS